MRQMTKEQYKVYRRNQRICDDNEWGFFNSPYFSIIPYSRDHFAYVFFHERQPQNIAQWMKKLKAENRHDAVKSVRFMIRRHLCCRRGTYKECQK